MLISLKDCIYGDFLPDCLSMGPASGIHTYGAMFNVLRLQLQLQIGEAKNIFY